MPGVMLAACIFVGLGLGVMMDHWLGTRPWFTLGLLLMGIVAGFYNVVRLTLPARRPRDSQ